MLKTSLFNKGIYKSQLSRFKWGSVLYLLLLFFTTSFILIINDYSNISDYAFERYIKAGGLILSEDYIIFPVLLTSFVPTVAAFLTFDMFSSKRHSVFIHSLPCGRNSIYFSTLLGAWTLMAVPVILNGIILSLISIFKLNELFSVLSCIKWVGVNLILLFIMFSVSTFSAGLTSNRVSMVFINFLLHILPLIAAFSIGSIASVYLYGFGNNFNYMIDNIINWMPTTYAWVFSGNGYGRFADNIFSIKSLVFIGVAAILYISGLVLYKFRNNETSENFVAFKVMNPIFKYTVTVISTVLTFSALHLGGLERNFYMLFLIVVISLVVYFASEMILKKNLKVLYAYKGYLIFFVICIFINLFMQQTSFFGYETKVPDFEKIESVAVYEVFNNDIPYCDDEDVIKTSLKYHKDIVKKVPDIVNKRDSNNGYIKFEYKLKGGKILKREYYDISADKFEKIMVDLYNYEPYKFSRDNIHKLNTEHFDFIRFSFRTSDNYSVNFSIEGKKNIEDFISSWIKDISVLGYKEKSEGNIFDFDLDYKKEYSEFYDDSYRYIHNGFNHNYKNVIKFFEEKGYLEKVYSLERAKMYISKEMHKIETVMESEYLSKIYFDGKTENVFSLSAENVCVVNDEDKTLVVKDVINGKLKRGISDGEKYIIYVTNNNEDIFERWTMFLTLDKDNIPEYLLKYIN